MKLAHHVKVRVFVNEDEDHSRIKEKLLELFPFGLEKEKININEEIVTGAKDNKITILSVIIEKDRHIRLFVDELLENIGEKQKKMILQQLDSRIGDDGRFFVRLDKDKLLEGEYDITDCGNCFHIEMLIAAYPVSKDKAMEVVRMVFE